MKKLLYSALVLIPFVAVFLLAYVAAGSAQEFEISPRGFGIHERHWHPGGGYWDRDDWRWRRHHEWRRWHRHHHDWDEDED